MRKFVIFCTTLFLFSCLAGAAIAQTPKKTPENPSAPPAISPALAARVFKAQAQSLQAQLGVDQAQKMLTDRNQNLQAAISELQSTCGTKFQLQLDQSGDPVCVVKPNAKEAKLNGK